MTEEVSSQKGGVRLALATGFSVVLCLLALIIWVGLSNMEAIQHQLNRIVKSHNVKKDLVTTMRHAARERTVNLYRMITLNDPFARDAEFLLFNHNGALFAEARMKLKEMPLDDREATLLKGQGAETKVAVALQQQVVDLALGDQLEEASRLLHAKTVPAQDRVFVFLSELQEYQTQATRLAEQAADKRLAHARAVLFLSGGAALLLGGLIALFVVRYTTQAEARLFREKKKAVVTLHSIGEGVITTDAWGQVNYLNTVAAQLTGWTTEQARGRNLLQIFKVHDEQDQPLSANPVMIAIHENRILNSAKDLILENQDGQEFGVEYTVAPIRDSDGSVLGAVLVFRDITEIRRMASQMAYQATHDTLTGLINRFEFESRLELALQSARQEGKHHTLLYMDLDQFKVVNDTCGHIAGDELLKQIASRLQAKTRKSDTLARLGGDEFALLLANCTIDSALHTADALCKVVNDFRFIWEDQAFRVSASIGVVEIKPQSGSITDLLSAADNACYVAKDLGRNRIHVFQPDDLALAERQGEMQWLPRIRNALEEGQFRLFYQQIVPISAPRGQGHCEILLRMVDADDDLIPPGAFLPAAERYGLMCHIDRWVIAEAFKFLSEHPDYLASPDRLWTINLSGQTICDDDFLDFVIEQFQSRQIPPSNICFEVTETTAVRNLSQADEVVFTLRAMGCRFALDDFGSGLSSFNYLKHLKVDFLKIDGSFVRDMLEDSMDLAMVESINQIGQLLGLKTIAEFVETDLNLDRLQVLRVDFAQGFGIHRPEPLSAWKAAARISA